mmetsp:Transcript_148630/g.276907  ORF Transcript_148630/g.276907 Transcript_148630/m.276907 type:complete len:1549 (+) Transcript_148630:63-4709(+)
MSGASAFDASHEADIGPIVPGKPTAKQLQVLLNGLKKELAKPEIQKSIKEASASVAVRGEMARRGKLGLIYATCTRDLSAPFGFTHDRAGQDAMLIAFRDNAQDPEVYRLLCDVEELLDVPRYTWWGFTQLDDSTPTLTCEQAKDAARSMLFILQSKTYKESMRACPSKEIAWAETGYQLRPITLAFGFGWNSFSTMTSVGKLTTAIQAHAEDSDILFLLKDIEKASFFADGALSTLEASDLEDSTTAASSDQEQVEAYGKPLLGKVVELSTGGVEVRVVDSKHQNRFIDVDGQRGRIIDWDENEESYVVQTFDGETVLIQDERFLQVIKLPRAVEGGTHLFYPVTDTPQEFGRAIADWLDHKGFCMVQMSESKETRKRAAQRIIEDGPDMQDAFRQEIESAYLGTNNTTQVKAVPPDAMEVDGSPLKVLSQQVFTSLNALSMYTEEYFGYECWATTSIWARVSEQGEDIIDSPPLTHEDTQGSHVQAYERFLLGRKICILYMVDNAGGEVQLCPRNGSALAAAGFGALTLPISGNKMLIFRHDQLSYSYQPKGPSFALQSWMLTDIPLAQQNLKVMQLNGVKEPPPGENAQVMSLDCKMPADAVSCEKAWSMFFSGTDACQHWPTVRWETEPYYTEKDDFRTTVKSYTCHGNFMNEDDFANFDHDFFGISHEEAAIMCPGQRTISEVGYGCMYKAGHSRESLRGENIGTFFGDVGFDWFAPVVPYVWSTHGESTKTQCMAGIHVGVTVGRLAYIFDMKGPLQTTDTACSASLVALQAGHKALMHQHTDSTSAGRLSTPHSILTGGINSLLAVGSFVSMCQAGMLSHLGRCFTFDRTADGFMRGEGHGCLFIKWTGDPVDVEERFACVVGSCSGQDGKSASLTAPNGPAQQDVIRRSMRMAGVDPSLISVCECHGTGTPLGDPIEVGSLQGVMRGKRPFPLLNTSAKTNVSHLEACAGACGVMKCVLMVMHAAGPPNCHMRGVNPNLITDGYPVFFQAELCDTTFSTTFIGVSSFGFGGTNSRADVYGRCVQGVQNTGNVWTKERIAERAIAYAHGLRGMNKGYEKLDETVVPRVPISIIGSWDNFQELREMRQEEPGCFTYRVTLGDTRRECFQLCLAGDRSQKLYPALDQASSTALIFGPEGTTENARNRWLIDGRRDAGHQGTTYRIVFRWQGAKSISWEHETAQALTDQQLPAKDYYICGSWGSRLLSCISEEDALYEGELVVDKEGMGKFQFRHDNDANQTIYPHESGAACGPDMYDKGKEFVVRGSCGEKVKVQLAMKNGRIGVSAFTGEGATFRWQGEQSISWDPEARPGASKQKVDYFVCGSWSRYKPEKMSCTSETDGIYECNVVFNIGGKADFQFRRANEASQMIYPNEFGSVCGPDMDGNGKHFALRGLYGQKKKVRLCVRNARISVSVFSEKAMEESWVSEYTRTYYVTGSFNSWRHTRLYEDRSIKGLYRYHTVVLSDEPVEYRILVDDDWSRKLRGLSAVFPEADRRVLDATRDFMGKVGSTWEIVVDLNQDDPNRMIYHRPASHVENSRVLEI